LEVNNFYFKLKSHLTKEKNKKIIIKLIKNLEIKDNFPEKYD